MPDHPTDPPGVHPAEDDLARELAAAMEGDPTVALHDDYISRMAYAYLDEPRVWAQCREVLKAAGYLREVAPRVKKKARQVEETPVASGRDDEPKVAEEWPDAPVDGHGQVPAGYRVAPDKPAIVRLESVMREGVPDHKRIPVSQVPILITRRIGHLQDQTITLEVAWRSPQRWRHLVLDRDVAFSSRKLPDTARSGLPVGSHNAAELARYLFHYEEANPGIPETYSTRSMGWQGPSDDPMRRGFLAGERPHGCDVEVALDRESPGDLQEARSIHPAGGRGDWGRAIHPMLEYPIVRIFVVAALLPPLIGPLGGPNGVIDLYGRTSRGKTSILRIAMSTWRSALLDPVTWDATAVSVGAGATLYSDLPYVLDDTATEKAEPKARNNIGQIIYQVVSGRGRGRANRTGRNRARDSRRTLMITTGETPLAELVGREGASARCLSFRLPPQPFGEGDSATIAARLTAARRDLGTHYGHAGPAMVEYLLAHRDELLGLQAMADAVADRVRRKLSSPAASRQADVVGMLAVAHHVAVQAGMLPDRPFIEDPGVWGLIEEALGVATRSSDHGYRAWLDMLSLARAQPGRWRRYGESPRPSDSGEEDPDGKRDPHQGYLGFRRVDHRVGIDEYYWYPGKLRKLQLEHGYQDVDAILSRWRDDGVLDASLGRYEKRARAIKGQSPDWWLVLRAQHPKDADDEDTP